MAVSPVLPPPAMSIGLVLANNIHTEMQRRLLRHGLALNVQMSIWPSTQENAVELVTISAVPAAKVTVRAHWSC